MCTCETHGHCHECRGLTEEREYQYGDLVEKMPPFRDYTNHRCSWCLEWFKSKDMFTVGNWTDNRKVCGPECPDRPEISPLCIHPVGFINKGPVVQMPAKGRFTRMDTCTKCGQTRQVAWAKTHTIRDWSWS